MADQHYPLLLFPTKALTERDKSHGGGDSVTMPPIERQRVRIGPKFQSLQDAFDAKRLLLQQTSPGQDPDAIIVLETIGDVKDFFKAVRKIPGLEWLLESSEDDISPDSDFFNAEEPQKALSGRLYLIGTNQQALTQILSLWSRYQENPTVRFERGLAPWKHMFEQLRDVRYWGLQDRVNQDIQQYWQEKLTSGDGSIRFEIEIWHFSSQEKNGTAASEVSALIASLNGRILARTVVNEIAYHGILVEMPSSAVEQMLTDSPPGLLMSDRVMYFRPKGQAVTQPPEDNIDLIAHTGIASEVVGSPVVALLDGMPLQNHPLLTGNLVIDDPDGYESTYEAQERIHGTTMASLIALGDLNAGEIPLSRPIYVRPVLQPDPTSFHRPRDETTPSDTLLIDLMHRAIKRICEGENGQAAVAPAVRIINLSLGDADRPFDRVLSPWARLLDWFAFKYNVLFVISSGNHATELVLSTPRESLSGLSVEERNELALQALLEQSIDRPLLIPAEAINGITIGATHADAAQTSGAHNCFDLFEGLGISPYSRIGYGFRSSVKPDLLFPGGRILHKEHPVSPRDSSILRPLPTAAVAPGQLTAAPPSANGNTRYTRGTSNATALASRYGAKAYEVIENLRASQSDYLPAKFDAVLIKALMAHGAQWGERIDHLAAIRSELDKRDLKKFAARWLGYGAVDSDRALFCTEERATMVGVGELQDGSAYEFSAPLPPSLAAKVLWRRMTITLAWMSPINPAHQSYRRAKLWISPPTDRLGVTRMEVDWRQARKGTLQHEILDGENALAFVDGDRFVCKVNCAAEAGELTESVPFALCVTLEVAEGVGIPIYQEIRARITPHIQI